MSRTRRDRPAAPSLLDESFGNSVVSSTCELDRVLTEGDNRPERLPGQSRVRGVIGQDNRQPITPDASGFFPYCTVCSLLGVTSSGRISVGTGTLVGKRTIITARHCLFSSATGSLMQRVSIAFGQNFDPNRPNEIVEPFPRFEVGSNRIALHPRPEVDCGAILLDREPVDTNGKVLGASMGYADFDVNSLVGSIHNLGYPSKVPKLPVFADRYRTRQVLGVDINVAMWWNEGALSPQHISGATIRHPLDTTGGHSGGPIFKRFTDRPFARQFVLVGVHVQDGSATGANIAVRLDSQLFDVINEWRRRNDDL